MNICNKREKPITASTAMGLLADCLAAGLLDDAPRLVAEVKLPTLAVREVCMGMVVGPGLGRGGIR